MSTDLVPALRPGVRLVPRDDERFPGALEDGALGRRVKLDAVGVALAGALDAPQPLAALAARAGCAPEPAARAVASFARLHLLDTGEARALAGDAEALAAVAAAPPEAVPLLIRDDARFSCTRCGSCCGGHNVGPVFDDVLEGLADKLGDLREATRSAKGLFFAMDGGGAGPGGELVLCHQSRGSCVFLDDDRRCRVHAAYGADAKPRACRIFPYELVATPRGVAVTVQRECRGFVEARQGKRLADDEAHLRRILALAPALTATPRVLHLAPGSPLTWDAYEALEAAFHEAVDAHPEAPLSALAAMARAVRGALGAPPSRAAHGGTLEALRDDLDTLGAGLTRALDAMGGAVPEPTDALWVRAEVLDHLRHALAGLRPDWRRVARGPERPDQHALVRDHLHHALMSKALALAPSVAHGLARLVLSWLLTMSLAVHRAREVKRRHLVAQDLMDALVVTSFALRHQDLGDHVFPKIDDALVDLFVFRLDALIAHGDALADPDTRMELVKF